jgi:hypothetical protein
MPRVSRSVSQRYANASKKKTKRRGEAGHAAILPPRLDQAPIEVPAGLASPAPLDLPSEPAPVARSARAERLAARAEARTMSRGEMRHATRRATSAPIVDYSYVLGDLRRIGITSGVLLLVLIVLTFLPILH